VVKRRPDLGFAGRWPARSRRPRTSASQQAKVAGYASGARAACSNACPPPPTPDFAGNRWCARQAT